LETNNPWANALAGDGGALSDGNVINLWLRKIMPFFSQLRTTTSKFHTVEASSGALVVATDVGGTPTDAYASASNISLEAWNFGMEASGTL
jgi:hypothetical protein